MLSLAECEPNLPPRSQNEPLDSGTVKLEIIIGRFSTVTSANQTICRGSLHSLRIASSTIITISRVLPSLSLANSAIGIESIGNAVCAPFIADIGNLRHPARAPVRRARHQERNAGVAFPPVLVSVLQSADPRDQHRIDGIGNVPDLMRFAAEGAQHIDRVGIA